MGQFLSSRLVRNVFGQPRSRLSMRKAMDEGKIILVNLSKGKIGEDNANMIGSLLVTKIQIDAMARADVAAHLRRPFYLYIDEFQNFATKSFATILSEARKYKLSLILANQYTSQLDIDIKNAIFGNVGTIVAFTLGYDDAAIMTSQFKELVGTNDLISLPKYTSYTRLMIDGISSDPFSMKTLPPYESEGNVEYIEKIRRQSRQRYAMERTQLESLLNARNKKTFSLQEKVAEKSKLEGLGLSEKDAAVLGDFNVQQNVHRFADFLINGQQADAMVMDIEHQNFKYVRYTKPEGLEKEATLQYHIGDEVEIEEGKKLSFALESYQHISQKLGVDPLIIRVGDKNAVRQQLANMYDILEFADGSDSPLKFVVNVEKMQPTSLSPATSSASLSNKRSQQQQNAEVAPSAPSTN
ncbi:MAG: type IV secretory system conjugative DNA transfer family protein [Candidatus Peribacteria bacterium]|nr:type IV secretory system conjugative DNA transfer family protein [Candidatus Peribacteria bacterium]